MRIFLILYLLVFNLFANNYIDSITLTKIKKLVQKEEEIALAYKNYILEKGINPSNLNDLKTTNYLPKGFNTINPFGKQISLMINNNSTPTNKKDDIHKIEGFKSTDPLLKSNLYDYYYSNKYRTNTKAPLTINNSDIEIILSPKEKFIYENSSNITTTIPNNSTKTPKNKYYLDNNGVLHWYDINGNYKFSYDKELLLDQSVTLFNTDGTINSDYKDLVKDIEFIGMTILHKKDQIAEEHINISSNNIIKVNKQNRDIGKTIIQFSRRAGGMIVNGDIYTWGNNGNKITGINLGYSGNKLSNAYPVITGLVPVRAKMYDTEIYIEETNNNTNKATCKSPIGSGTINCKYTSSNCDNPTGNGSLLCKDIGSKYYTQNYFSSPNRPKFVDFFSTVYAGTCGISTKGELYCGAGSNRVYTDFGASFTKDIDSSQNGEMLYKSSYFDGVTRKAKKVFQNNQLWLVLSEDGQIYRYGYDHSGFAGVSNNADWNRTNLNKNLIETISTTPTAFFQDITYLLTIGYRKMGALSTTGDIYIWGVEDNNSNNKTCKVSWENISFDLCGLTKITTTNSTLTSNKKFNYIKGGLQAFVVKDEAEKYYKIWQPVNKKIQVIAVEDIIKTYSEYIAADDTEIKSVDFSSKLSGNNLLQNQGIVWVNGKKELKGDYFTSVNKNDTIFKDAIKKIKWEQIKVIDDDNGMCGIDENKQMYCWGIQSFYRSGATDIDRIGNTFMIPVFNTNIYDLNKDFLVAEGGSNGNLTGITSEEWVSSTAGSNSSTGAFLMKYPTYIGGFNYEFEFK